MKSPPVLALIFLLIATVVMIAMVMTMWRRRRSAAHGARAMRENPTALEGRRAAGETTTPRLAGRFEARARPVIDKARKIKRVSIIVI